jgi:magnesium transporter
MAAGISNDVEADDNIIELVKARLPWLFLGLLGGLGSVFILQDFEGIMSEPKLRNLFFYTPLIAAMAGNVGVHSSAIIVQGLAADVVKGSLLNRLIKELGLSLINGVSLGLLTIVFGQVINQPIELSLVISLSMLCVIVVAALIGTSIPIILEKRGIDPAIATGPFITTSNDIFGIFLFFYIAKISLLVVINGPVAIAGSIPLFSRIIGIEVPIRAATTITHNIEREITRLSSIG